MNDAPLVVGIGGTIGAVSSTERALRIALEAAGREGFRTRLFGGEDMARLPLYDPRSTARTHHEQDFVEAVRGASALIIASPGYHGSISGVVKNALDLLEETAKDERPYLADMPVGLIATAFGWQATGSTIAALRRPCAGRAHQPATAARTSMIPSPMKNPGPTTRCTSGKQLQSSPRRAPYSVPMYTMKPTRMAPASQAPARPPISRSSPCRCCPCR